MGWRSEGARSRSRIRPVRPRVCPYDIYGRLTLTQHLVSGTEDLTQRITYYYDSVPGSSQWPFQNLPSGCCSNTAGRLAAVQFPNSNANATENGYDVQQLAYMYSYNQAGRVTLQNLRMAGAAQYYGSVDVTATYTWDNMGRMTGLDYPLDGPQIAMTYDAMSNLSSETQTTCNTWLQGQNWVCQAWNTPAALASATYNFAGQLTTLTDNYDYYGYSYLQWTETHTYNGMMQLTNMTSSAPSGVQSLNMTYNFSATQNNGRIVSSVDGVTGENVSYTYDSLNRLIAASTAGTTGVQWGESYSYDGFGNLTAKVKTKGTAPQANPIVNSATNQARMSGDYGFDANGNWLGAGGTQVNTWNVENQLISTSGPASAGYPTYTYDPSGKRVLQYSVTADGPTGTLYFYSVTGQRLGAYQISYVTSNDAPLPQPTPLYFGGRILGPMDRLGSVRQNGGPIAYFPWGEERTSTPDGTDKFATYFRDVSPGNGVGEDYANARYYNNNFGRFWSPDPFRHAKLGRPQSWDQYLYAGNDPVSRYDPQGTDYEGPAILANDDDDESDDGSEFVYEPFAPCGLFSVLTLGCDPGSVNPLGNGKAKKYVVTGYSRAGDKEATIASVLQKVLDNILSKNNDCSTWLTGADFSGAQFVSAILGSGPSDYTFGYGQLNSSTTAAFTGVLNSDGTQVPGLPIDASITVNSTGAFFNSADSVGSGGTWYTGGTLQAQAFILIHEIAHNVGATGFQPDNGNPAAEKSNNLLVQQNCGSAIKGLQ